MNRLSLVTIILHADIFFEEFMLPHSSPKVPVHFLYSTCILMRPNDSSEKCLYGLLYAVKATVTINLIYIYLVRISFRVRFSFRVIKLCNCLATQQ